MCISQIFSSNNKFLKDLKDKKSVLMRWDGWLVTLHTLCADKNKIYNYKKNIHAHIYMDIYILCLKIGAVSG